MLFGEKHLPFVVKTLVLARNEDRFQFGAPRTNRDPKQLFVEIINYFHQKRNVFDKILPVTDEIVHYENIQTTELTDEQRQELQNEILSASELNLYQTTTEPAQVLKWDFPPQYPVLTIHRGF